MAFPTNRLRRLRRTETLRTLVRETRLTPEALVYPLFICPGKGIRKEVRSMPGVFNLSVDEAVKEVRRHTCAGSIVGHSVRAAGKEGRSGYGGMGGGWHRAAGGTRDQE